MKVQKSQYDFLSDNWIDLPNGEDWNHQDTLILAFCSPDMSQNHLPLAEINERFPLATVVGCSTSGEIHQSELQDHSLSVTFLKLQSGKFKTLTHPLPDSTHSKTCGSEIGKLLQDDDLKAILILSEGLEANGSKLVEGLNSVIDPNVVIGGGLAGDGTEFKSTFTVYNDTLESNRVIAVGFYGEDLHVSSKSQGGWDIFGPQRTITKSKDNVLFEIDNQPALELYKKYLGEKASELPASALLFPIEISPPDEPNKKLVRTILGIDESANAMIFAGDLPEGWQAQLMQANFERVIDASGESYKDIIQENVKAEEELVIAISCVGRRLVLGERCEEEIEVICDEMNQNSHLTGFYSYGEIAPCDNGKPCELHNQSMTLFSIKEVKKAA